MLRCPFSGRLWALRPFPPPAGRRVLLTGEERSGLLLRKPHDRPQQATSLHPAHPSAPATPWLQLADEQAPSLCPPGPHAGALIVWFWRQFVSSRAKPTASASSARWSSTDWRPARLAAESSRLARYCSSAPQASSGTGTTGGEETDPARPTAYSSGSAPPGANYS